MGCNCGGSSRRAGSTVPDGRTIVGYRLIFPETGLEPQTFATSWEAKAARRKSGIIGSTIETVYQ